MTQSSSYDVVVIGAGLAGLVATHELLDAGHTVTCIEARDRVGGRAFSVQSGSTAIDLGATWYWSNETRINSLIDSLGLGSFPQHLAGDALFDAGEQAARRLQGNPIDSPSLRFRVGAHSLPLALAQGLPDWTLVLGEPVEAIIVDDDGALVRTQRRELRARQIVLAVPPALVVETIRFTPGLPEHVKALAQQTAVWMGSMVKAVAIYGNPFWRRLGLSGSAISHAGPFRVFHDHSGPDGSPAAIFGFAPSAAFSGNHGNSIAEAFREQLTRIFGAEASEPVGIQVMDWSAERFTQPVKRPAAGTNSYGDPVFHHPVHNRIHWASTETAPAYAGHLEGAVIAGLLASQAISDTPQAIA